MNLEAFTVPPEDRGTFVKVMALVARADGHLAEEEIAALENALQAWAVDVSECEEVSAIVRSGGDLQQIAGGFADPRTGLLLLQELVTLAFLDGHYAAEEREAILQVASIMAVSEARVEAIEQWVRQGMAWRQAGIALLEPEVA